MPRQVEPLSDQAASEAASEAADPYKRKHCVDPEPRFREGSGTNPQLVSRPLRPLLRLLRLRRRSRLPLPPASARGYGTRTRAMSNDTGQRAGTRIAGPRCTVVLRRTRSASGSVVVGSRRDNGLSPRAGPKSTPRARLGDEQGLHGKGTVNVPTSATRGSRGAGTEAARSRGRLRPSPGTGWGAG